MREERLGINNLFLPYPSSFISYFSSLNMPKWWNWADTLGSGSSGGNSVGVRVPPSAPINEFGEFCELFEFCEYFNSLNSLNSLNSSMVYCLNYKIVV